MTTENVFWGLAGVSGILCVSHTVNLEKGAMYGTAQETGYLAGGIGRAS